MIWFAVDDYNNYLHIIKIPALKCKYFIKTQD